VLAVIETLWFVEVPEASEYLLSFEATGAARPPAGFTHPRRTSNALGTQTTRMRTALTTHSRRTIHAVPFVVPLQRSNNALATHSARRQRA